MISLSSVTANIVRYRENIDFSLLYKIFIMIIRNHKNPKYQYSNLSAKWTIFRCRSDFINSMTIERLALTNKHYTSRWCKCVQYFYAKPNYTCFINRLSNNYNNYERPNSFCNIKEKKNCLMRVGFVLFRFYIWLALELKKLSLCHEKIGKTLLKERVD